MRGILSSSAATVLVGALFVAGGAAANPTGVPVSESPPLSCTSTATYDGSFTTTAIQGPTGEFPISTTCNGLACADYGYRISSMTMNVDRAAFSVSRTQDLNPRTNTPLTGTVSVFPPGQGAGGYEESRGFLADAVHEYVVRFNNSYQPTVEAHIYISGESTARIGTVLVRGGEKRSQPCLIATPGVTSDRFQPLYSSQNVLVAGGKCFATKFFENNFVVDVQLDNSTPEKAAFNAANNCQTARPEALVIRRGDGTLDTIKNNVGEHGITSGDTSTCYGPRVPSRPVCICTKAPCP